MTSSAWKGDIHVTHRAWKGFARGQSYDKLLSLALTAGQARPPNCEFFSILVIRTMVCVTRFYLQGPCHAKAHHIYEPSAFTDFRFLFFSTASTAFSKKDSQQHRLLIHSTVSITGYCTEIYHNLVSHVGSKARQKMATWENGSRPPTVIGQVVPCLLSPME